MAKMKENDSGPICHYSILEVDLSSSFEEIKAAYRKKCLQWHPDRNIDKNEEATEMFKLIHEAYTVLSDPTERTWYDSHRDNILNGENINKDPYGVNIWSYFNSRCFDSFDDSENGFYSVYSSIFIKISLLEENREWPSFGTSVSPYSTVRIFYKAWENFVSSRSFAWCDKWHLKEAQNRQVKRSMEKENKKERELKKKEYQDNIRSLVKLVKRRDPRVIQHQKNVQQENEELKKKEKEKNQQLYSHIKMVRQEYQHIQEELIKSIDIERKKAYGKIDDLVDNVPDENISYMCYICNKSFKSMNQYKNHEKSQKHKQKEKKYLSIQQIHHINTEIKQPLQMDNYSPDLNQTPYLEQDETNDQNLNLYNIQDDKEQIITPDIESDIKIDNLSLNSF